MPKTLTPQILVWAYSHGIFPMAPRRKARPAEIQWFSPDPRAVIPLDAFHLSRSLARRLRRGDFTLTRDRDFHAVIRACAEPRPYAGETWINDEIIRAYTQLHDAGMAHSLEAWDPSSDTLVGGVYGVALGGAFFGESMFSRRTDASKVCLAALVAHLRERGYVLFDVQMSNPHLEQFGLQLLPRDEYLDRLRDALPLPVTFENK